jgi:MFS family permease
MVQTAPGVSRRAAVAGCALGLAVGWNHSDVGAIAGTFASDYGVSLGTVGLFTAVLFTVHAALQLPSGRAVDALGSRRVGLAAICLLIGANALALVAPEPAVVLVARALTGLGTAAGFVAGIDYVRVQGGSPFAQGAYGGMAIGGAGLALAVVPLLADRLAWRAPFVGAIAVALVAGLLLARGPSDRRARVRLRPRREPRLANAREPAGSLSRLCLLSMVAFGLSVILGNWVVTLLERGGGLAPGAAGGVGSLVLLGGICSRPLGGWISRRHPDRNRAAIGASFAVAGAATLLLALGGSTPVVLVGALALGLAAGIPFAPLFGAAARVRPSAPAAAVALVNMASNLVIVAGIPLLGITFSLPGSGRVGFVVAAAIWFAAMLLVPGARELETAARPLDLDPPDGPQGAMERGDRPPGARVVPADG